MAENKSSRISGFHKLTMDERLEKVKEFAGLTDEEVYNIKEAVLPEGTADRMIENVVGAIRLPVGIATNFLINGKDALIPMAIEESSVVAAASLAAKLCRDAGGFYAEADEPIMIGQIQLLGVSNYESAKTELMKSKQEIIEFANTSRKSTMVEMGGGLKDIEAREVGDGAAKMLIVHLLIDVRDAMGANAVNTMCEAVAPLVEQKTGGKALLRILSNMSVYRRARARAVWTKSELEKSFENSTNITGEDVVNAIITAWKFAVLDPYRKATHHKGIMNGIDAVMIATGNDWRSVEAGAHTFSAVQGLPLTTFSKDEKGNLVGEIDIPLACGTVGGATKVNPVSQVCLKILGANTAQDLAKVAACVGIANNFSALRALAVEGIQRGHLKLHATNLAVMAGAEGEIIDVIASQMTKENNISHARAREILAMMQHARR